MDIEQIRVRMAVWKGVRVGVQVRVEVKVEVIIINGQFITRGNTWHDFDRNSEVSLRSGLAPVSDRITRRRNAIFGHVARLPDNIPAHQAMLV